MVDPTSFPYVDSQLNTRQRRVQPNGDGSETPWFYFDEDQFEALTADQAASGVAPVTVTATVQTDSGAFTPVLSRLIIVTTTGSGTAQLLRSVDGGTTKLPVTQGGVTLGPWTGPINEPVWIETEAGATLYLRIIPSSGTMTGRIAQ